MSHSISSRQHQHHHIVEVRQWSEDIIKPKLSQIMQYAEYLVLTPGSSDCDITWRKDSASVI